MRNLVTPIALMVLIGGPAAMGQTGSNSGARGAANSSAPARDAPIGHRQPRVGDLPSERNPSDPNDPLSKGNAALDKKIKNICRGC
jgi:hypothetical protein